MYEDELAEWRAERDAFFAGHYASPLSDEAMAVFNGLDYYPADESLVFKVRLAQAQSRIGIVSSTGSELQYPAAGTVIVPFPAATMTLRVLRGEEDDLYIPFRDATSGVTTYGAGRYVGVARIAGDEVTIDFNKAINPYCAYDPEFSCPLPPAENWLDFEVAAGEKDWRTGA